jgi:hypothetical protein
VLIKAVQHTSARISHNKAMPIGIFGYQYKIPGIAIVAASAFSIGFILVTRQKEKDYRSGKRKFVNGDYL